MTDMWCTKQSTAQHVDFKLLTLTELSQLQHPPQLWEEASFSQKRILILCPSLLN